MLHPSATITRQPTHTFLFHSLGIFVTWRPCLTIPLLCLTNVHGQQKSHQQHVLFQKSYDTFRSKSVVYTVLYKHK